jgi:acetyltransferase-like isoleucine patch superfamily enzyme
MRQDRRPYYIKKLYLAFRGWYTEHYIAPKCDYLGAHHTFMKPWLTHISGPNIRIGQCATVISEPESPVRIGVWGHEPHLGKIEIGDYVLISPGCRISASDEIIIGNSVMIANGVYITDSDWHGIYDRVARPKEPHPVHIGNNVWLGDHATVLKGVTIGENSIIAAHAVITRDVPANVVMAGNPAQIVKELDISQGFRTRADFFKDPVSLAKWFDGVDRMVLKENGLFNWLRALVWPTRKD